MDDRILREYKKRDDLDDLDISEAKWMSHL